MASVATTGHGAKVEISADLTASPTYTELKQVNEIGAPEDEMGFSDITNFNSPGRRREWTPTLLNDAQWTFKYFWNTTDGGQLLLSSLFYKATLISVRITYPPQAGQTTGLVRTFQAYVQKNPLQGLKLTEATEITATLKMNGDVTDVAGS